MMRAGSDVKNRLSIPVSTLRNWLFVLFSHTEGKSWEIGFSRPVCSLRRLTLCRLVLVPLSAVGECVRVRLVVITVKEKRCAFFARVCLCVVFTQQLFPFDNHPKVIDAISASLCESTLLSSDAERIVPAHGELREAKEK